MRDGGDRSGDRSAGPRVVADRAAAVRTVHVAGLVSGRRPGYRDVCRRTQCRDPDVGDGRVVGGGDAVLDGGSERGQQGEGRRARLGRSSAGGGTAGAAPAGGGSLASDHGGLPSGAVRCGSTTRHRDVGHRDGRVRVGFDLLAPLGDGRGRGLSQLELSGSEGSVARFAGANDLKPSLATAPPMTATAESTGAMKMATAPPATPTANGMLINCRPSALRMMMRRSTRVGHEVLDGGHEVLSGDLDLLGEVVRAVSTVCVFDHVSKVALGGWGIITEQADWVGNPGIPTQAQRLSRLVLLRMTSWRWCPGSR